MAFRCFAQPLIDEQEDKANRPPVGLSPRWWLARYVGAFVARSLLHADTHVFLMGWDSHSNTVNVLTAAAVLVCTWSVACTDWPPVFLFRAASACGCFAPAGSYTGNT